MWSPCGACLTPSRWVGSWLPQGANAVQGVLHQALAKQGRPLAPVLCGGQLNGTLTAAQLGKHGDCTGTALQTEPASGSDLRWQATLHPMQLHCHPVLPPRPSALQNALTCLLQVLPLGHAVL